MIWLSFILLTLKMPIALAQTVCAPSSCTPSCGSSCTYQTCTSQRIMPVVFDSIPYTFQGTPSAACSGYVGPRVITTLPTSLGHLSISTLRANHSLSYRVCQTQTNSGPPCPPPPPPPPAPSAGPGPSPSPSPSPSPGPSYCAAQGGSISYVCRAGNTYAMMGCSTNLSHHPYSSVAWASTHLNSAYGLTCPPGQNVHMRRDFFCDCR